MTAPDPQTMTAAEFRSLREGLGITAAWLAAYLDIAERTILRWEYGRNPLRDHAIATLRAIADDADTLYGEFVDQLDADPDRPIVTYRTDDEYRAAAPGAVYPASWHRAVAQRVTWDTPGARIVYHEPPAAGTR